MPNGTNHLEPTDLERKVFRAAQCLVYVKKELDIELNENDKKIHEEYYPATSLADYAANTLYSLIKGMDTEQLDRIVYNSRNKQSRRLADWWEEYQEADRKRISEEQGRERKEKLRKEAISKLSDEEREVLGL